MLRTIFGPKKEEAIGSWRRLYNEELDIFNYSPNIINLKLRCSGL